MMQKSEKWCMHDQLKNMDAKEIELPSTIFVRDIETRVLQGIVLQSLAKIKGISLLEGNLLDTLLGRELERVKGIFVVQDQKKHSVDVRVEINVMYGVSIPEKSEEIQAKVSEEISLWTGLHVASVHVVFKDLLSIPKSETKEETKEEEALEEVF